MGANIAGIYGAQIFRSDDRPKYRRGFSINIAIISVAICLAVVRFVDDLIRRRRKAQQLYRDEVVSGDNSINDELEVPASDVQPQPVIFDKGLHPVAVR